MSDLLKNLKGVIDKEWEDGKVPTRISIRKRGCNGAVISVLAETTYMARDGRVHFADVVETPGEDHFILIKRAGNREVKPGPF